MKIFYFFVAILTTVCLGISKTNFAQHSTSKDAKEKLTEIYNQIKNPEISLEKFIEINSHVYTDQSTTNNRLTTTSLAIQDPYCSKVRPYCTNGDFESGLDQNQYVGAYGLWYSGLYPDPFSLTYGFISGPLNSNSAHQTIVNKASGNDPITGIPLVSSNGGNQALRLGNSVNGNGTEIIAKTIVVNPTETILSFYYAVVFEDPNHDYQDQPAFSVRVYDCATGSELMNVCDLGNGQNIAVSDAENLFFKSLNGGAIAYRDWSTAQINLSAYVGKTVIVVFTNKDCNLGGHYGYTYLDNLFSSQCPKPTCPNSNNCPTGTIENATTKNCGAGNNICAKYSLPVATDNSGSTITGSVAIDLSIYQNNTFVKTITSPTLTQGTSYCFNIDPSTLGINTTLLGFDYVLTGRFALSGFNLSPITVGNPPGGMISGVNNDYLSVCSDYYSKSTGDLHNVLTWGVNMDGSGANPPDFGAGKTFHLVNRDPSYTLTGNWTVGGVIDVPNCGSSLAINGYTLSVTRITGLGCSLSSYLSGSLTSNLIITGNTVGQEDFFFAGAASDRILALNSLTIDRTGSSASIRLRTPVDIYGVLTVNNGNLSSLIQAFYPPSQSGITLKSNAANTARVAPIPLTGSVSGNVTVERYIPARRAWRIMSAPVGGSQSINAAWQEGATTSSVNPDPNPGFGTHITEGSAANGFDHNPLTAMASVLKYASASNAWVPFANTNATSVNSEAYLLFVRGNRGTPLGYNSVPATNTTLRATGPLKTGDQLMPVSATGFTAIANPFASPINFATITRTNVPNNFYLYDPKLGGANGVGGYVLVSDNGMGGYNITPAPISAESQFVQSGQGFLVSSTGVAGSLLIKESDKSATPAADVFRSSNTTKGLRTTLQIINEDKTVSVVDEAYSIYSSNFSNKVDAMDPVKLANINENIGILRDGQTLMIERRREIVTNDTIHLKLWNLAEKEQYLLQFTPENLSSSTIISGFLEDKYLHTSTPVSLSGVTKVSFMVDGNAGSADAGRFMIVLTAAKNSLPADLTSIGSTIKLSPNPITGKTINIQFIDQAPGTYNVALINSMGQVVYKGQIKHAGGSTRQTMQLDQKIVKGVYQMRVTNEQLKFNSAIPVLSN